MKDTLALIEIAYRPARGKGPQAKDAITDAIDVLFETLGDGLIEAGESIVRFVQEAP